MTPKKALERAIKIAGGPSALERKLKAARHRVTQQAISLWTKCGMPERWALPVARAVEFNVTPNELAPEAYPNPWDALPVDLARPLVLGAGI